jgi:hypothetical protein
MINNTLGTALKIFRYASPGCIELWAFGNAANHNSFAHDTLNTNKMNLEPGGDRQPKMRRDLMVYLIPNNHPDPILRGQARCLEIVLRERGLWPAKGRRADGFRFLHQCPINCNRCNQDDPEIQGQRCARTLMAAQRDFQAQKGRLQQEHEATGQEVILYPKFHCELDFIENRARLIHGSPHFYNARTTKNPPRSHQISMSAEMA